jgi:hypothetical protein
VKTHTLNSDNLEAVPPTDWSVVDEEPWSPQPEPIPVAHAALLTGLCYGFVAGIAFTLAVRAVWR